MSAPDDEEEKVHWNDVMRTLLSYEEFVAYDLARRQDRINKLPAKYADRLPDCTFGKFEALQHACNGNQVIFEDMVQFHRSNDFGSRGEPAASGPTKAAFPPIPLEQQHRNIAVLHSLHREWSKEGEAERITTFKVLVDELKLRLPVTAENAYLQRVLVPGCGLGRLPLEIAAAGYACQGNEYSAFMALASNFMLNGVTSAGEYRVYPWISNACNIRTLQDSMQAVDVPDVAAGDLLSQSRPPSLPPATVPADGSVETALTATSGSEQELRFPRFSMATGDFVRAYTNLHDPRFRGEPACVAPNGVVYSDSSLAEDPGAGRWDAVVTCFFIDTAPVVLEYVETIERLLKPGGVWINLGPLLYHWATAPDAKVEPGSDARYNQSVELSYEEVRHVVAGYGFEMLQERWQDCTYTRCDSAMMWTTYRTVQFTARKPVLLCRDCTR